MKNILSFNWVYLYADMWNVSNPFEQIDLVDFDSHKELKEIFEEVE